ncbi:MAG: Ig-like domain-containing protein [Treponema sp.]|nr:Ig-like domain-containing protein [Candidatus Treponema merdequi]
MRIFYNTIKLFFILVISSLLFSCADKIIPELKITNVAYTKDVVIINFSETVNQNLVIESFSFTRDSEIQNGSFIFNNSVMYFYPNFPIQDGYKYTVQFSTKAEDIYGASLMEPYVYNFTTKGDPSIPEVVSITPKDQEITDTCINEIEITFSKSIRPVSFQNSFSIKPSVQFKTNWENDNKTVKVIFDKPLENSTRYTVSISKSLQDTDNNFLANAFTSIFTNNEDLSVPEFKLYAKTDTDSKELLSDDLILLNDCLSNKSYLSIEFSKPVNVDTISSYFTIKPQLSYTLEPDNESKTSVKVVLADDIEWNDNKYQVTIKEGIADFFNNKTESTLQYNIAFNKPSEMPVCFEKGFLNLKRNGYFMISEENTYTDMIVPVEDFQEGTDIKTELYFFFKIASEASEINLISMMESVSINASNSCLSLIIDKIEPVSSSQFNTLPFYSNSDFESIKTKLSQNKNLYGFKLSVTLDNADPRGSVTFNLGSEIMDNLKNKLSKKIILSYNKS